MIDDTIDSSDESSGFHSRDTEIFIMEGLEDTTVRPPSPRLFELGMAEREKIARWESQNSGFPCDTEIFIIDGLEDTTVRPPSPRLLELGMAEREKIARWSKLLPSNPNDSKDVGPQEK